VKKKLILIGGGGHCKSCIDVIEQSGHYKIAGIIDKQENIKKTVLGYAVIGTDEHIERFATQGYYFLITVGQIKTPLVRQKLFNELIRCHASMVTIISPRAYVSKHAVIDEGTIIMHDALINADARIGKNCIINSKALIEHDVLIGDHCHISTSAIINGGTEVKNGSFVGSNSVTKSNAATSKKAFIQAGSLFLGESND